MQGPLSSTGKRWRFDVSLEGLSARTEAPDALMVRLKRRRGLSEEQGTLAALYTSSPMPSAAKAADRIREAMQGGERIGIFGDYDCDGVTSTAQMVRYFRRHGMDPVVRLPHRVHDGYGLKPNQVEKFYDAGVGLLITVDTGISAADAVDLANQKGIDVIILDHHHVPAVIPDAYAILHPALYGYAEPHSSAAGVTFEFLHTLEGESWQGRDEDLALAAFGVIADLVPLLGRNRLLVQEGLRAMHRLPMGPVREMLESVIDDTARITSTDIAFRIAPRLNAAGRMADPLLALQALLEGGAYLAELETLNTQRQLETKTRWAEALKEFYAPIHELPPFLMVANEVYQPGILGLLAGKLTEAFGRPSMAVHINGEKCSASLRSTGAYNIVEGLERASALLTTYGGHAQAAGCTFPLSALPLLTRMLTEDIASRVGPDELVPTLTVDGVLDPVHVSLPLCRSLAELGPFGHSNGEPLLLLQGVTLRGVRCVGGDGQHLQAMLGTSKVIGFHLGAHAGLAASPMDLLCRVGIDTWNGRMSSQLSIADIRPAHAEVLAAAR
jgi:single-stranded-DNA-specific exonuclease